MAENKTTNNRKRAWDASRKNTGKKLPEIIDAAAKIFSQKGYKEATLEDIADEVGMLKGSLYYYITKKEDLLYAVVQRPLSEMIINLRIIAESTDPPNVKLEKALQNHINGFKNHQTELFVLISIEWFSSEIGGDIAAIGDEYDRLFRKIIIEGIEKGEFRKDLDPKLMTFATLGVYNYMQRWYSSSGGYSMDDIGVQFSSFVKQALQIQSC